LRYKPRTDIPTPNIARLGQPLFYPLTPFTPPKQEFPEYKENPTNSAPPSFVYNESPIYSSVTIPPVSGVETRPRTPPSNVEETPSEIYESPDPYFIVSEPEEKPIFKPTPDEENDQPIEVEIIEVQRSMNIHKALLNYLSLTKSMRYEIMKCNLELNQAIKRCEVVHGTDQC